MVSIEDALAKAVNCWNAGDLDGYLELYDDRIRLHGYSAEPMNKRASATTKWFGVRLQLPAFQIHALRSRKCFPHAIDSPAGSRCAACIKPRSWAFRLRAVPANFSALRSCISLTSASSSAGQYRWLEPAHAGGRLPPIKARLDQANPVTRSAMRG
jgi:hypothetical protein